MQIIASSFYFLSSSVRTFNAELKGFSYTDENVVSISALDTAFLILFAARTFLKSF